jgi:hypothetical protein
MTTNKPILSAADRAALPASSLAPAIALIKPQMGENIGARTIWLVFPSMTVSAQFPTM